MKKVLKKMLMFLIVATMLLQMGITIFAADSNGSAEQPVAAAGGLEDLAKKSVQYLHQLADNKIKDAIGKIPVVGGTVKSLFGSYIDKLLGIEKKESTNDKLAALKAQLTELAGVVEKYSQTEMKKIYELQFTSFQETLSKVKSKTDEYLDTILAYDSTSVSDDEKTLKVASLTKDSGFGSYLENINLLSQYITDEILQLHDDGGIFTRAYKVYCADVWQEDQCALGGEAAMEASEYVNAISGVVDTAQTTAAMMLLARCNVGKNVEYYQAEQNANRVTKDVSLTGFNPTDAQSYTSKYNVLKNFRYDIFGVTEEDVNEEIRSYMEEQALLNKPVSEETARTKVVSVKPGVVGEYNQMIADNWFYYIDSVDFTGNIPEVKFIPMDGEIGFVHVTDLGFDATAAQNFGTKDADEVCGRISKQLLAKKRSALDDSRFTKLLKHIEHSEYFNWKQSPDDTEYQSIRLRNALVQFGFSFEGHDKSGYNTPNYISLFLTDAYCSSYIVDGTAQKNVIGSIKGISLNNFTNSMNNSSAIQTHSYFTGLYGERKTVIRINNLEYVSLYFQSTEEINSAADFKNFISNIAAGNNYAGKNVILTTDIDLGNTDYTKLWNDSNRKKEFCGTFDGQCHTIKGLNLTANEHRLALFRTTGDGAVIKNLNLVDFTINNKTYSIGCGALVGFVNGNLTVENVTSSGKGSITGYKYVGGLIGETAEGRNKKVTLKNCANHLNVTSENVDAGGLIGNCAGLVLDGCVNTGYITAKNGGAGGIAGYIGNKDNDPLVTAMNCQNGGTIIGYDCAGGIIGNLESDNSGVEITNNENYGTVTVTAKRSAGGIVGRTCSGGLFKDNINSGNIENQSQNDDAEAGGILGENEDDGITMSGNENHGNVTANKRAGGIAGTLGDRDHDKVCTIENNVNSGRITSNQKDAGGIVGAVATDNKSHKITGNTNSGVIFGQSESGGIVGWMAGGGVFEGNVNQASVTSVNLNAGGIAGRIQDDSCMFSHSDVGDPVIVAGSTSGESNYSITAQNAKQHAGKLCGWDGKLNKVIDNDNLLASIFGSGNIVIILVSAAVIAAAAVAVVLFVKKKKKSSQK